MLSVFERYESNVRTYCRSFPAIFSQAKNAQVIDSTGRKYIDFFAGAGALNYGHNPEIVKQNLLSYIERDGILHSLDMFTEAKQAFLESFTQMILNPRGLDYKIQFCGPTGTNAVEASLKLARLVTGRANISFFTGGWHGMTAGSSAICGNKEHRQAVGMPLVHTSVLPYPVGPRDFPQSLNYLESLLTDPNSGYDTPAAIILETVQAEGGIWVAPENFLLGLREICTQHNILLIIDDIQAGCGRTGCFFSFERAGIVPDIVCLSKSIGAGIPMGLVLIRPDLDIWKPGQHTGTFRGNQLAFIAARVVLDYWQNENFILGIQQKGYLVKEALRPFITSSKDLRGLGLFFGLDLKDENRAARVAQYCFEQGLIIERCGRNDTTLKIMPPLTIEESLLKEGLQILSLGLMQEQSGIHSVINPMDP